MKKKVSSWRLGCLKSHKQYSGKSTQHTFKVIPIFPESSFIETGHIALRLNWIHIKSCSLMVNCVSRTKLKLVLINTAYPTKDSLYINIVCIVLLTCEQTDYPCCTAVVLALTNLGPAFVKFFPCTFKLARVCMSPCASVKVARSTSSQSAISLPQYLDLVWCSAAKRPTTKSSVTWSLAGPQQ